jgi:hypothetical protein
MSTAVAPSPPCTRRAPVGGAGRYEGIRRNGSRMIASTRGAEGRLREFARFSDLKDRIRPRQLDAVDRGCITAEVGVQASTSC